MSSDKLPPPPVPADLDLRNYPSMLLDVDRLRNSDLALGATAEVFRASVLLWCAAWHQVPAGSLPDNDRVLCSMAGYGRDMAAWEVIRDGVRDGFRKCSDGRLYHITVCEKALEITQKKESQKRRTKAASEARWAKRNQRKTRDASVTDKSVEHANGSVTERNINRKEGESPSVVSPPSDSLRSSDFASQNPSTGAISQKRRADLFGKAVPENEVDWRKVVFDEGTEWLKATGTQRESSRRQIVGKWRADAKNDDAWLARRIRVGRAEEVAHPQSWMARQISIRNGTGTAAAGSGDGRPPSKVDQWCVP